jgi:RHS repeat-associated protein
VRYDHTQRPLRISRGTITQSFDYAPSGEKFRESGTDGEVAFFGKLERRYSPTAQDKLYAASNAIVTQTGATRVVQYLLSDRLGSVDAIADSSGALAETRGYDAFGKPRTGTWADATPPRLGSTANTPHGFTGHEHLNSLELIHMNGRVYDYNLGRFMEVDPIIQSPLNSQSLNPYSYIGNNPLSGTDPTGYFGELPCIMPTWACRQQVTGQGPDEEFGFTATMAKLGLSQGGGNHNFSISNATRRIMDSAAHTSNGAQVQITVGPLIQEKSTLIAASVRKSEVGSLAGSATSEEDYLGMKDVYRDITGQTQGEWLSRPEWNTH